MPEVLIGAVSPVVVPETGVVFAAEVESWLDARTSTQAKPGRAIRWVPRGLRSGVSNVRCVEHLSLLVSHLPGPGEWAVAEWASGDNRRWGQTMRLEEGWIVEVHNGTAADFAQRVYRSTPGDYPTEKMSGPATVEVWPPLGAATVLWSWLHGTLPDGCSRTLQYLSPRERKQLGL